MRSQRLEVSIVIVTMNHLCKLKNLLASIYQIKSTDVSYEVIIVDNCSDDGSIAFIKRHYAKVRLHINAKVNGFAYNNNLGVSLSKGTYIFICNPDVILLKNSLSILLAFAKSNPRSAILCPKLLNSDYSYQASVRSFHSLKILFWRLISFGNDRSNNKVINDYLLNDFNRNVVQHVDWAIGAALVVHHELYKKLNGFDEKFFLYVEDEDLCLRAWKLNYPVTYLPHAVMIHDHQRGSFKKINRLTWIHLKSFLYFFYKHNIIFKGFSRESIVVQPAENITLNKYNEHWETADLPL